MGRPLRVLIVEDNESDALLLLRELRRGGYEPTCEVVDTIETMRAALARRWDVVISDYVMPCFSAPAALSLVTELNLDIPTIIVSGSVGEEIAVEAMRSGARDFMVKGNLARLLPAIEREIREARMRAERIAERTRAEAEREGLLAELREAVTARDIFLTIASHELKTPLTSLQIQTHLLTRPDRRIDELSVQELEAAIAMISRQITRLRTLIDNMLDVANITSGRFDLFPESIDLSAIVTEVVAELRSRERFENKVVVETQPVVGVWDRPRLESVIASLVSNAVKFGEGKPIKVMVSSDGQVARLAVTDQGIGLSPDEQMRIFKKFERAVSERQYGGFGLGLWLVRQIVEAHGGTIRVISQPAKGASFIVDLPLGLQPSRSRSVLPDAVFPEDADGSRPRELRFPGDEGLAKQSASAKS